LKKAPAIVDAAHAGADARRLAGPFVRCYETNQAELSVLPSSFSTEIAACPRTAPLARQQAEQGHQVTNLKHELVRLDDLARHILRNADGHHDSSALLNAMLNAVETGGLLLQHDGSPTIRRERAAEFLKPAVENSLAQLAEQCLFLADDPK